MLVSAISSNNYSTYYNPSYGFVNTRGLEIPEITPKTPATDCSDGTCNDFRLYYNISQWKHFCHKQIDAGNLDVIS